MLLGLLSTVLIALDHNHYYVHNLRSVLSVLVAPVQYAVYFPSKLASNAIDYVATQQQLLIENKQLIENQRLARVKLQRLASLERENQRLKELLQSPVTAGEQILVAQLIQVDQDPFSQRVVLDKGTIDGVYVGQPVLDAYGVMGQVTSVGPVSSIALLITDSSHALGVQSNRSGVRSIAEGTGNIGQLKLKHVTNTADLKVGDLLVTSGLGERFPPGYPVGHITKIGHDPGESFVRIEVNASAHLDRSREVLLLWSSAMANNLNKDPETSPG